MEGDSLLLEELHVGVDGVLKLRLQIHLLNAQSEAPVLHLGEVQQLLHHVGQPPGLLEDDAHAPLELLGVRVLQQRLPPAVDGGEGGAQLVGHGGDELRLDPLALADLAGHVVDGVDELADLVPVGVLHLGAVAAPGDALGGLGDLGHRLHHIVDEHHVGHVHHPRHHQQQPRRHAHGGEDLPLHGGHGGDVAHGPHHLIVQQQRHAHGHDVLPRIGVHAPEGGDVLVLEHVVDVLGPGLHAGGEAVGADDDLPCGADELQLHEIPFGKFGGKGVGVAVELAVAAHGVAGKVVAGVGGPGAQPVQHHIIVVVGHAHAEGAGHQQGHHKDGAQGAEQPALAQAGDLHVGLARRRALLPRASAQNPHLYPYPQTVLM